MTTKNPGKQRKRQARAPLHMRQKMVSAPLSKELRSKYKKRSAPVRKGDQVKVLRGSNKGHVDKVESVDLKNLVIFLEKLSRSKVDGTKVKVPIKPSNVQIVEMETSDSKRRKALERK